jgi:hypothetical protein
MTEELTPEDAVAWVRSLGGTVLMTQTLSAIADLIESQQARIEALERIIRTRTEVSGHNPHGLSDADAGLLLDVITEDTP